MLGRVRMFNAFLTYSGCVREEPYLRSSLLVFVCILMICHILFFFFFSEVQTVGSGWQKGQWHGPQEPGTDSSQKSGRPGGVPSSYSLVSNCRDKMML